MNVYKQAKYSTQELQEFAEIIINRLQRAHKDLQFFQEALNKRGENSIVVSSKLLEEIPDTIETENLSIMLDRQRKYIAHLEEALDRIKKGTYGICIITGDLIDKERLRIVPHSRHSLDAKRTQEKERE